MTKQKPAEERRQEILAAAARCFARKGFPATTMDDVAAESGLSKGSLYWYFHSKDELLAALMFWYLEGFEQAMDAITQQPLSARQKMIRVMEVFAAEMRQSRDLWPVMLDFMSQARQAPQLKQHLERVYADWIELLGSLLDQGVAEGELRPVNSRALSAIFVAVYDGLALQDLLLGEVDWDAVTATLAQVLFDGLTHRPAENDPATSAAGTTHTGER